MALKVVDANVARTVEGLRDTGYTLDSAVADLIDNSIEADATAIDVILQLDSQQESLFILSDNGTGMNENELENAMRYGADEKSKINRLGKYGLGLKTASTSFCRSLTVISQKAKGRRGIICAANWDLDLIVERSEWIGDFRKANADDADLFNERIDELSALTGSQDHCGTVVLWEKIDRLVLTKQGEEAQRPKAVMTRLQKELTTHLGMVFQRFLDHERSDAPNVTIRLNGEPIEPWDPFCENFEIRPKLQKRYQCSLPGSTEKSEVAFRAFILPKPHEIKDDEVAADYDRYRRTAVAARQGFFVYRENRLIEEGQWYSFGNHDTHLRSLRIEVNFKAEADELFGVGLRKQGLDIRFELLDKFQEVIPGLRATAQTLDRSGSARKEEEDKKGPRVVDRIIKRRGTNLVKPDLVEDEGGLAITNKHSPTPITVVGPDGRPNSNFNVPVVANEGEVYVDILQALDSGVLWEPAIRNGSGSDDSDSDDSRPNFQVRLNAGHDWYQKALFPNKDNSPLIQAIEFLLYALGLAELNNVKEEFRGELEEFRVDVSRNLRELAKDLPVFDAGD